MNNKLKKYIFLFVSMSIVVSIIFIESQKNDRSINIISGEQDIDIMAVIENETDESRRKDLENRIKLKSEKYELGKEISTPDGFVNIDSIGIGDLIGKKVILVDFWTYSCINCQRTLPHLNSWHEKYADQGLVILGIHTPEFDFEKDYDNVVRAVEKYEVKYPVVLDNDYSTWSSYKNRYWPRKYLIDIDGFIVYDHIGEGAYDQTEEKIIELLNERSEILGSSSIEVVNDTTKEIEVVDFSKVNSPEIYFGYSRLEYLANLPSNSCIDVICNFVIKNDIDINTFLLEGDWKIGNEQATFSGNNDGSIVLAFSASKVNLVAGSISEDEIKAEIYLDGELLDKEKSGVDVENGIVTFNKHDLYNLVDLKGDYGQHVLLIKILNKGFQSFAFTFG